MQSKGGVTIAGPVRPGCFPGLPVDQIKQPQSFRLLIIYNSVQFIEDRFEQRRSKFLEGCKSCQSLFGWYSSEMLQILLFTQAITGQNVFGQVLQDRCLWSPDRVPSGTGTAFPTFNDFPHEAVRSPISTLLLIFRGLPGSAGLSIQRRWMNSF